MVAEDVSLIDIALPKLDGLEAAAELKRQLPSCKTLILTGVATPGNLRRGAENQVAGFMLKDATPEELVDAVRTVDAGGSVIRASPISPRALATADGSSLDASVEPTFSRCGVKENPCESW